MNDISTETADLKKLLQSPEGEKIRNSHDLDWGEVERYLDVRDSFKTTGDDAVVGYPPFIPIPLEPDFPLVPPGFEPTSNRKFDDVAFKTDISAALSGLSIAGYTVQARRRGQTLFTLNGGSARIASDSDPMAWSATIKMHVASVSKLVTSMAMTKLMVEKDIDTDTPVMNYLPTYFTIHPSAKNITLRHLLTHTSGFRRTDEGGLNDGYTFGNFKYYMQKGVKPEDIGSWHYNNGNYIGLRIAMAIITGEMAASAHFNIPGYADNNDVMWDALSIAAYVKYIEKRIFRPASVTASLQPGSKDSLAYSATLAAPGWAADATPGAGTDAWWFSAEEILKIMTTYWGSDAIVRQSAAHQALRYGFGLDQLQSWQLSTDNVQDCFMKGGFWADGGGRTQQCVVAFAPDDTTIAAFVNSPIAGNTIGGIVTTHLQANIA